MSVSQTTNSRFNGNITNLNNNQTNFEIHKIKYPWNCPYSEIHKFSCPQKVKDFTVIGNLSEYKCSHLWTKFIHVWSHFNFGNFPAIHRPIHCMYLISIFTWCFIRHDKALKKITLNLILLKYYKIIYFLGQEILCFFFFSKWHFHELLFFLGFKIYKDYINICKIFVAIWYLDFAYQRNLRKTSVSQNIIVSQYFEQFFPL